MAPGLLRIACVAGALAACDASVPSCDDVGEHVAALLDAPRVRSVFASRCELDGWSAEMRRCLHTTTSVASPRNCKQHLDAAQQHEIEQALAGLDDPAGRTCEIYEALVDRIQGCELLTRELRQEIRDRLDARKRTWRVSPLTRGGECAAATAELRVVAAECPGDR